MKNIVKFMEVIAVVFVVCVLVSADLATTGKTVNLSRPAISYVVEGVERDGTFTVFGEGLTPSTKVWLWQPGSGSLNASGQGRRSQTELQQIAASFLKNQELPGKPPDAAQPGEFLGNTGSPQVAMVCRKASSAPANDDGAIMPTVLWIGNDSGFSSPYMVNAPQLWFSSDQIVVPGQQMRLFGINLSYTGNTPSLIALTHLGNGTIYWGQLLIRFNQEHANVRQHEMSFRIPADIPYGAYSVRVYRFDGGPYGWSNKLDVTILQKRSFVDQMGIADQSSNATPAKDHSPDSPPVFRITNGSGDGITDNITAIQSVLDKAGSTGGGLLFFHLVFMPYHDVSKYRKVLSSRVQESEQQVLPYLKYDH